MNNAITPLIATENVTWENHILGRFSAKWMRLLKCMNESSAFRDGKINPVYREMRETIKTINALLKDVDVEDRSGRLGGKHGDPDYYKNQVDGEEELYWRPIMLVIGSSLEKIDFKRGLPIGVVNVENYVERLVIEMVEKGLSSGVKSLLG
jgi:hypothetical protein